MGEYDSLDEYVAAGCPAIADSGRTVPEQHALIDTLRPYRLRPLDPAACQYAIDDRGHVAHVADSTRSGAAELIDDLSGECEVIDIRQRRAMMPRGKQMQNYAVSKFKPRVYIFFSEDVPLKVRANPLEWATWFPVELERVARIGESPLSFCARNHHKHRIPGCNICSHQRMLGQENAAAG